MDALMRRTLAGCARVVVTIVIGLTLNGIEYRPNTADAGSSLNTVVITGFPAPNQVMQVLPGEEMRRAQYPRYVALLRILGFAANFWFGWAIIRMLVSLLRRFRKVERVNPAA